jgi:hypothetical protein
MTHRFPLTCAALLLVSATAWADDEYTISYPEPRAGQRTRLTETGTDESHLLVTDAAGKKVQDSKTSGERSTVVVQTVVALKAGTKKPEKLTMKFDKYKITRERGDIEYGLAGKTVVAELKDKEYALSVEGGGELLPQADATLKGELHELYVEEADFLRLCLPAKPVPVGGTWSGDLKAIAADVEKREGFKIDTAKAKAAGKLLKAYKKDGHTFGEYEIAVELPVLRLADEDGVEVKAHDGSRSKMTYSFTGCIDGSLNEGVMTVTVDETVTHTQSKMKGSTIQTTSKSRTVVESKELTGK